MIEQSKIRNKIIHELLKTGGTQREFAQRIGISPTSLHLFLSKKKDMVYAPTLSKLYKFAMELEDEESA